MHTQDSSTPAPAGRVLVVDDEPTLRRSLERLLTARGFRVTTAGDGFAAVQLMASDTFDVVLTDLMMPKMNGLQLLEHVKRAHPEIEVFIMTAFGDVESAVRALREGASNFLTKPFHNNEDIVEALQQAVERAMLRRATARDSGAAGANDRQIFTPEAVRILRSVAHDLVSTIAIIATLSDLIGEANGDGSTSIGQDARTLRKSADYCRMLVENLRQLYSSPAAEGTDCSMIDVVEALTDVIELLSPKIPSSVSLELALPVRLEAWARPTGLRQVLFNLIKNAVEAMRDGGRLRIQVTSLAKYALIVISDTGPGIPSDDASRIFQLHFTTKRNEGGTGTGLYLSKSIANQMGGALTFQTVPGKGSTFSLKLRSSNLEPDRVES